MGLTTLSLGVEAADGPGGDGLGTAAIITGVITAGLIAGGAITASRGANNLATYRDMLAEELYMRRGQHIPGDP